MVETAGNLLGESQLDSREWSVLIPVLRSFCWEVVGVKLCDPS